MNWQEMRLCDHKRKEIEHLLFNRAGVQVFSSE
jgi:hypothetical protein